MKKFLSYLIILFIFISNTIIGYANNSVEFYVYSSNTEQFDQYAEEKIGSFMYAHYGYINTNLKLGKGTNIISNDGIPKVLYPIWIDNEIVATFVVANVSGTYSGTYSEDYITFLNTIKNSTDTNTSLKILIEENSIFGILNNNLYDLKNGSLIENHNISIENINSLYTQAVNTFESISFNAPIIPRIPTSYNNGWLVHINDSSLKSYCYAYCLYNIFRNLGITGYSINTLKSNDTIGNALGFTSMGEIASFLNREDFSYISASSGFLSFTNVKNIIYNYDNYIMIGLTLYPSGGNHFMVLYGYTDTTIEQFYTVWDPQSSSGGVRTMDASTRLVTDSDGDTFIWNAGYFGNFSK